MTNTKRNPKRCVAGVLTAALALGTMVLAGSAGADGLDGPKATGRGVCAQSKITLVLVAETGEVFMRTTAGLVPIFEGPLRVGFGSLDELDVVFEFTTGDWDVEVSGVEYSTSLIATQGSIATLTVYEPVVPGAVDTYVVGFDPLDPQQLPTVPTLVIETSKQCPPQEEDVQP